MTDNARTAPLELSPDEFRRLGHRLVDRLADFLASLPSRPVTRNDSPSSIRAVIGNGPLPASGAAPAALLDEAVDVLVEHSLFNGHPRFMGYITSSAAPIGTLGDLLASAVNPNTGAWILSPAASSIEAQAVRWIAELVGYPSSCGGLLVSGGNMANFVGFLAARASRAPWKVRERGLRDGPGPLTAYVSKATHTWIHKAADLFGLGTDAIRWIPVDGRQRMDVTALERQLASDREQGNVPFIVVGTAGTVEVGAIDPLGDIAAVCRERGLWFHVDGAYGAPAAVLPEAPDDLKSLALADSVAIDPHKWLYAALEAGCVLVRDPHALVRTFSYRPDYYFFDGSDQEAPINYFEHGFQNSRGFRALRVWLALRHAGRDGYVQLIRDDVALARQLFDAVDSTPELEAVTHSLSITTFRFVPRDLAGRGEDAGAYLNDLNRALLERVQAGGELFVSNAVIDGTFLLRACIVNFRTTAADVAAVPGIVVRLGRELDATMRPDALRGFASA
jgi:glutamate/tyrosine decarboxylase-like PLP-dependent enzyme